MVGMVKTYAAQCCKLHDPLNLSLKVGAII